MMSYLHKIRGVVASKLTVLYCKTNSKITIGKNVKFRHFPRLVLAKNTKLILGNNVVINSDKRGYSLNMHSSCKLLLDKEGGYIKIGDNTRIHGTCIHAYQKIEIGKNCLIAANTQILDGSGHDLSFDNVDNRIHTGGGFKPVIIEDSVWIGANTLILPGVTIGYSSRKYCRKRCSCNEYCWRQSC